MTRHLTDRYERLIGLNTKYAFVSTVSDYGYLSDLYYGLLSKINAERVKRERIIHSQLDCSKYNTNMADVMYNLNNPI